MGVAQELGRTCRLRRRAKRFGQPLKMSRASRASPCLWGSEKKGTDGTARTRVTEERGKDGRRHSACIVPMKRGKSHRATPWREGLRRVMEP